MKQISFSIISTIAAVFVTFFWAPQAKADSRCPYGYKVVVDAEDDSEDADQDGLICIPESYPENGDYYDVSRPIYHYYGGIAFADPGGAMFPVWNHNDRSAAERAALKACRNRLKADKIKGKCRLLGAWYNGDAYIASGDGGSLFLEMTEEQALGVCRRTTTNCSVIWTVTSLGEQSGARQGSR